jgi:hypothetical protein
MAKRNVFEELKLALEDALAHERGEKVNLRTTQVPALARKNKLQSSPSVILSKPDRRQE